MMAAIVPGYGAAADRDIVYSARYYNPPSNKATSRFHLYRINPDGSGRIQLTRGDDDDRDPKWSPDGKCILFLRTSKSGNAFCVYEVKRNRISTLYREPATEGYSDVSWAGDSRSVLVQTYETNTDGYYPHTVWKIDATTGTRRKVFESAEVAFSPTGTRKYIKPGKGSNYLTSQTGGKIPVQVSLGHAVWLNQDRVSGTDMHMDDADLYIVNSKGETVWKKTFRELRGKPSDSDDLTDWYVVEEPRGLPNHVICKQNVGHAPEGANRVWGWNLVDVKNSKMETLLEGMSVAMERGGKRYTAVPIVKPVPYDGKRTVFVSPLQVITLANKQIRTLVSGTVWVNSADWR